MVQRWAESVDGSHQAAPAPAKSGGAAGRARGRRAAGEERAAGGPAVCLYHTLTGNRASRRAEEAGREGAWGSGRGAGERWALGRD